MAWFRTKQKLRTPKFEFEATFEYGARLSLAIWSAALATYAFAFVLLHGDPLTWIGVAVFFGFLVLYVRLFVAKYKTAETARQKSMFDDRMASLSHEQRNALVGLKIELPTTATIRILVAFAVVVAVTAVAAYSYRHLGLAGGVVTAAAALTFVTGLLVCVVPLYSYEERRARDRMESDVASSAFDDSDMSSGEEEKEEDHFAESEPNPSGTDEGRSEDTAKQEPPAPRVRPWFEVLGVSPDATTGDIKRAWREAIVKYHPDRVTGLGAELVELADRRAKELNVAYEEGLKGRPQ